jgi:hypothetical protein
LAHHLARKFCRRNILQCTSEFSNRCTNGAKNYNVSIFHRLNPFQGDSISVALARSYSRGARGVISISVAIGAGKMPCFQTSKFPQHARQLKTGAAHLWAGLSPDTATTQCGHENLNCLLHGAVVITALRADRERAYSVGKHRKTKIRSKSKAVR